LSKDFWESLVGEYFTAKAVFKFTLWKDNAQTEAKPFDITMPILHRFFLVTAQSGVSSMSFNFEGAKERMGPTAYTLYVESLTASWTFYYLNGYIVTLRGPFNATVVIVPNPPAIPPPPTGANGAQPQPQPPHMPYTLKIDTISFDAQKHEKALRVECIHGRRSDPVQRTPKMMMKMESSPAGSSTSTIASASGAEGGVGGTPAFEDEKAGAGGGGDMVVHFERATIPSEPVNAFGIPQATMRCLEASLRIFNLTLQSVY
ncbi:uncharacterized protein FOMMEDRAFT_89101, partial [Fomitiporia mediterranea MF3/22]|uniref:uncharacterized protein n=1 Tax=Fomitiporia mediterranea (strain MF3/22) TaxID=694068 RepID=UPI0004408BEB